MKYDHYFDYREVTETCRAFAREYPGLVSMSSIGKTYEGRDIWAIGITDASRGAASDKAAFLMNGNIHAVELTSSMAVLYAVETLLRGFGRDPNVTRLLTDYAVYAIPRIQCDGAELCLKTPYTVRGSVEKFYGPSDGVVPEDINGDGEILLMRVEDPSGDWKASRLDPRIMEKRGPFDTEGKFYRVLPEGMVRGEDLVCLRPAQAREALDPNREFPFEWSAETNYGQKPVSGPEPLHDRETRALYDFVNAHPNIAFVQDFHTYGGFHISPAAFCPHIELPAKDAEAFSVIGEGLAGVTGYQSKDIFPQGAKDIARGSYTTWLYFERGIMAWCTELWDFLRQADPARPDAWNMFFVASREQFDREETTALRWDEERNGGRGFMPWTEYDHPQLGKVEIGGWREKFTKQNPPAAHMEGVIRKGCACAMASLACMPRLAIEKITSSAGEDGTRTVEAAVMNAGFLSTASTAKAAETHVADDLTATLEGAQCLTDATVKLGALDGYAKARVVWKIRADGGAKIRVTAKAARAGAATAEIELE